MVAVEGGDARLSGNERSLFDSLASDPLAIIQDFDVEVAQTSFIADPIVGIIQDGLTKVSQGITAMEEVHRACKFNPSSALLTPSGQQTV